MSTEMILQTIHKACKGKCAYIVQQSLTTQSVYCQLKLGNVTTNFRISDHQKYPHKMRSFVYTNNTKSTNLERFINNAITDLKQKSLYQLLESVSDEGKYV